MKTRIIKLSDIAIDGGTQQRVRIDNEVVSEYAEAIQCGAKFPSITVFFDGAQYWLVDGFHRYHAHKTSGIEELSADVHEGTNRDARLFSAGVNGTHGIRLTNADKRNAVMMLLEDSEWTEWTNRDIAKHCKVTHTLVNKMRAEIEEKEEKVEAASTPKNNTPEKQEDKKTDLQEDSKEEDTECDEKEQIIHELKDTVVSLDEENTRLKDAIAANQLPEDEIQSAAEIIADLRHQIKALEAELSAVKSSRDGYLVQNAELKKQCASQRNQLKKLGAGGN